MTSGDADTALVQTFEGMSDTEAQAWIDAGDFSAVAGLPLPDDVSKQFAAILSGDEVQGFQTGFGAGASSLPVADLGPSLASIFKQCASGKHFTEGKITVRKADGPPGGF